ncbi:MAG: hypothetical protein RBT03_04930, partial [Kiritimatiellia bacterium]|nr:hypothetical protein [Kiritimatiellia bacterium]
NTGGKINANHENGQTRNISPRPSHAMAAKSKDWSPRAPERAGLFTLTVSILAQGESDVADSFSS